MRKLLVLAIILVGLSSCELLDGYCIPIDINCEECYNVNDTHISTECYDDEGNLVSSWYI